jgi:hypothetical protein
LRVATGYPGGNEINLAIERGEVGGRCGWSWSSVVATHKHWLEQNRIAVLIQTALTKHADLPDVPLIADLAKTEEQRQIVRLIFARLASSPPCYGRLAIKSISTRAALASPVTPMHVRAGRLLGGKYDA